MTFRLWVALSLAWIAIWGFAQVNGDDGLDHAFIAKAFVYPPLAIGAALLVLRWLAKGFNNSDASQPDRGA